ncbi:hypothetical protein ACTXT7_011411 [Hymenolepis weldensis]
MVIEFALNSQEQACEKIIGYAITLLMFAILDVQVHEMIPTSNLVDEMKRRYFRHDDLHYQSGVFKRLAGSLTPRSKFILAGVNANHNDSRRLNHM